MKTGCRIGALIRRGVRSGQPSEARISRAILRKACRGDGIGVHLALIAALFLGTGAFALNPARTLTQARLSVWTNESGLPQATINAIVQTRDGYLWMGTEEGLVRFDGVRFVVTSCAFSV
jgi:Two component regulator propeller